MGESNQTVSSMILIPSPNPLPEGEGEKTVRPSATRLGGTTVSQKRPGA